MKRGKYIDFTILMACLSPGIKITVQPIDTLLQLALENKSIESMEPVEEFTTSEVAAIISNGGIVVV